MEAEKRRTTQIKARLAICSTAISSVEAVLSPLSSDEEKEFVDGFKVYLLAAIGQFVQSGPGSTPPALPARRAAARATRTALPPSRTAGLRRVRRRGCCARLAVAGCVRLNPAASAG